jgi:hypothetical protein
MALQGVNGMKHMSEKTEKFCKRGSFALTVMNGCILFAASRQLHQLSLRSSADHTALSVQCPAPIPALFSMPSILFVLLTIILLAVLIGKEWLRPPWVPLVVNVLWLAAGSLLLLHLLF